jgi:hypothetical protein
MSLSLRTLTACSIAASVAWVAQAQPASARGKIESVTVYRGQALVTRALELTQAAGLAEVVVTDLPPRVLAGSLYAEGGSGVQVRSVQFRTRPVAQDVREDVRKIDAELLAMGDRMAEINAGVQRLAERRAYLEKMENFVAPTAQVEMSKGVLNAETLTALADYSFKQREEMSKQALDLSKQLREVQGAMEQKQRERDKLTAGSAKTVSEAVVFLSKEGATPSTLKLRYLVDSASWTPSYNVRGDIKSGKMTLEYFASVAQMSGEDWDGVQVELSTATPAMIAKGPDLLPMQVSLAVPADTGSSGKDFYAAAKSELKQQARDIDNRRNREVLALNSPASRGAVAGGQAVQAEDTQFAFDQFDLKLNDVARADQILDLVAADKVVREDASKSKAIKPVEEGLSVTYTLAGRTSVPSRTDRQLIQIASVPLKADYAKVAAPVLTPYVYDEAKVTNESGMVLLAGPLTAYSGGSFVGNGELPTVSAGESFSVGFGIDSSLRAQRDLVERTETVQGGNKLVEVAYRLSVENFGAAPAKVRLADRLPVGRDNEIRITILNSSVPAVQEEVDRPGVKDKKTGVIRWELEVPAQAIGGKAAAVEYKFKMEYDKQMTVVGVGGMPVTPGAAPKP